MTYLIENTAGDILVSAPELSDAIQEATRRLEDDPELRELDICELDENENFSYHVRTVTFGPDADWQSVVVVLKPGEKIQPPGDSRWRDEDIEAYEREHDAAVAVWDERDKFAERRP